MRAIRLIFSLLFTFLYAYNFGCIDKYELIKQNGKYIIHVYDDNLEDDLSLDAKAFLMSYLKKEKKIKGNFSIIMSHFLQTQSYKCNNEIHQVFEVPIQDIQIVKSSKTNESFLNLKKRIYYKIAQIEIKEKKTLNDLKKLYNLYLSIGKINKANKIMDKIINYKMKGF